MNLDYVRNKIIEYKNERFKTWTVIKKFLMLHLAWLLRVTILESMDFLYELINMYGVLNGGPQGVFCATPFSGSATRCPTGIPTKEETTRAGGPVCKTGSVFRPPRILMYSKVCRWAWEYSSCRMVTRIGEPEVSQFPYPSWLLVAFAAHSFFLQSCTFVIDFYKRKHKCKNVLSKTEEFVNTRFLKLFLCWKSSYMVLQLRL